MITVVSDYGTGDTDMLEVNALKNRFCISLMLIDKYPKPVELFCKVLNDEKIPHKVSRQ